MNTTTNVKNVTMGLPLCSGGFVRVCNVLARIVILQNTNVQEIKDDYINKNYREATLKAARGNLLLQTVLFWQQP
jgi:cell division protein FtsI (penicillin-binding protein 3)